VLPLAALEAGVLLLPLAGLEAVVLALAELDGVVALLLEELHAATPTSTTMSPAIPANVCRRRPPAALSNLVELGSFTINNLQLIEPGRAGNTGQQSFAEP
jgi:hypothetical protein